MEFLDRLLTCSDCGSEFIFTAGEQLFFFDKQFKNDPKRCKPCKSKRAGLAARTATGQPVSGLPRTETRTECSACGIETTVPFKPTQGRPVLCRQCFQDRLANPAAASQATQATSQLNTATAELMAAGPVSQRMASPATDRAPERASTPSQA
jgi:CxxC-x17-CxxC domain-containing protein